MVGGNLKKKSIGIAAVCLVFIILIGYVAYEIATDPADEWYKDRIEYPLKSVNANDNSEYMLVREGFGNGDYPYAVITDTQMIKKNISVFSVDNIGKIYGTTPDGLFTLYKDGKYVTTTPFDSVYTKKIEYGTLEFRQVNKLQLYLLCGNDFFEQGENYSILWNKQNEKPYYSCFIHGENLESLDTVYWIDSTSHIDELPRPQKTYGDVVEFTALFPTYAGDESAYWYFRLSDYRLSQRHLNVKAIQENIIVCTDSDYRGSRIIVRDMFDKAVYYKEITGDFSEKADRLFLLNAEFTADGKLNAEYLGKDEQVHNTTFSLE